jgi:ABC-2 type transport system permease protein
MVYVAFLPALSMRVWSEDLRTRTFELWMTLPLRPAQIVLGKYLAALCVLLAFLIGTLPLVVMLASLGAPDYGRIAAGYVGAFLLGAQLLAAGQLASALTADQVLAFLGGALAAGILLASGAERVVAVLDGLAPTVGLGRTLAEGLSALPRYELFVSGTLSLAPLLYFAATAGALLGVNVLVAARSRT